MSSVRSTPRPIQSQGHQRMPTQPYYERKNLMLIRETQGSNQNSQLKQLEMDKALNIKPKQIYNIDGLEQRIVGTERSDRSTISKNFGYIQRTARYKMPRLGTESFERGPLQTEPLSPWNQGYASHFQVGKVNSRPKFNCMSNQDLLDQTSATLPQCLNNTSKMRATKSQEGFRQVPHYNRLKAVGSVFSVNRKKENDPGSQERLKEEKEAKQKAMKIIGESYDSRNQVQKPQEDNKYFQKVADVQAFAMEFVQNRFLWMRDGQNIDDIFEFRIDGTYSSTINSGIWGVTNQRVLWFTNQQSVDYFIEFNEYANEGFLIKPISNPKSKMISHRKHLQLSQIEYIKYLEQNKPVQIINAGKSPLTNNRVHHKSAYYLPLHAETGYQGLPRETQNYLKTDYSFERSNQTQRNSKESKNYQSQQKNFYTGLKSHQQSKAEVLTPTSTYNTGSSKTSQADKNCLSYGQLRNRQPDKLKSQKNQVMVQKVSRLMQGRILNLGETYTQKMVSNRQNTQGSPFRPTDQTVSKIQNSKLEPSIDSIQSNELSFVDFNSIGVQGMGRIPQTTKLKKDEYIRLKEIDLAQWSILFPNHESGPPMKVMEETHEVVVESPIAPRIVRKALQLSKEYSRLSEDTCEVESPQISPQSSLKKQVNLARQWQKALWNPDAKKFHEKLTLSDYIVAKLRKVKNKTLYDYLASSKYDDIVNITIIYQKVQLYAKIPSQFLIGPVNNKDINQIINYDNKSSSETQKEFKFSKQLLIKYMEQNHFISKAKDKPIFIRHDTEIFELILKYIAFTEDFETQYSSQDLGGFEINPTKIFIYKEISAFNNKCQLGHSLKVRQGSSSQVCTGCQDKDDKNEKGRYFKRQEKLCCEECDAKSLLYASKDMYLLCASCVLKGNTKKVQIFVIKTLMSSDIFKVRHLVKELQHIFIENIKEFATIRLWPNIKHEINEYWRLCPQGIRDISDQLTLNKMYFLGRRNKLVNNLFNFKMKTDINRQIINLQICKNCHQLFHSKHSKVLTCRKTKNGQGPHEPEQKWELINFLNYFKTTSRISMREIYLKVWSYLYVFRCSKCMKFFQISQLRSCQYESPADCQGKTSIPSSRQTSALQGKKKHFHSLSECFDFQNWETEKKQEVLTKINQFQHIIIDNISQKTFAVNRHAGNHVQILNKYDTVPFTIIKPNSANFNMSLNVGAQQHVFHSKLFKNFRVSKRLTGLSGTGGQNKLELELIKEEDEQQQEEFNVVQTPTKSSNVCDLTYKPIDQSKNICSDDEFPHEPESARQKMDLLDKTLDGPSVCTLQPSLEFQLQQSQCVYSTLDQDDILNMSGSPAKLPGEDNDMDLLSSSSEAESQESYDERDHKNYTHSFHVFHNLRKSRKNKGSPEPGYIGNLLDEEQQRLSSARQTPTSLSNMSKGRPQSDDVHDRDQSDDDSSSEETPYQYNQEDFLIDYSIISSQNVKLLKKLGEGGQAQVYECQVDLNDEIYASKLREVYNNQTLSNKALQEAYQEFTLASKLEHPNIVKYHYLINQKVGLTDKYHIIMENLKGQNLKSYILKNRPFSSVKLIKDIGLEILSAMHYLHSQKLAHMDLKPQNIIISDDMKLKLIDLGISEQVQHDPKQSTVRYNAKGTCRYLSPDQVRNTLILESDIWQFGCILLELATGEEPFYKLSNLECIDRIRKGQDPLRYILKKDENKCQLLEDNDRLKHVIKKCLQKNHLHRPSSAQLLAHKFFKQQ